MKRKQFFLYVGLLLGISVILFFIQNSIVQWLSDDHTFFYPVWGIYLFHFLITAFIFTVLFLVGKFLPKYVGLTFMGFILIKMIASVVFLIPLIKMDDVSKIPDFGSFFIPYFIYLFLEILLAIAILNQAENKIIDPSSTKIQKNKDA